MPLEIPWIVQCAHSCPLPAGWGISYAIVHYSARTTTGSTPLLPISSPTSAVYPVICGRHLGDDLVHERHHTADVSNCRFRLAGGRLARNDYAGLDWGSRGAEF